MSKEDKKPCPPCQLAIDTEKEKAKEMEKKYLKLEAEFENYKKQHEQIEPFERYILEDMLKTVRSAIDNLEEVRLYLSTNAEYVLNKCSISEAQEFVLISVIYDLLRTYNQIHKTNFTDRFGLPKGD